MRAGVLACLLVAATQPGVRARALTGYAGDDFWTLEGGRGVGLALIAAALCAALLRLAALVSSRIRAWGGGVISRTCLDAGAKMCGFAALYIVSPQGFYIYYRQIIPGLPNQWVIRWPEVDHVLRGLAFAPDARLAEHLAGLLFWGLVLQALWLQLETRQGRLIAGGMVITSVWLMRLFS